MGAFKHLQRHKWKKRYLNFIFLYYQQTWLLTKTTWLYWPFMMLYKWTIQAISVYSSFLPSWSTNNIGWRVQGVMKVASKYTNWEKGLCFTEAIRSNGHISVFCIGWHTTEIIIHFLAISFLPYFQNLILILLEIFWIVICKQLGINILMGLSVNLSQVTEI